MTNMTMFWGKKGSSYNIITRVYHIQSVITDFMVKTAFIIASVHSMAVTTLMERRLRMQAWLKKSWSKRTNVFISLLRFDTSTTFFSLWDLIIFHSWRDGTITDEGLQSLTYARHSWPLSIGRSLACHTYFDTGHPFIMVIFEDP